MATNDLRHHKSRVGSEFRNFSSVPLHYTVTAVKKYLDSSTKVSPDTSALEFYLTNHASMLISSKYGMDEPLSPSVNSLIDQYYTIVSEQAVRMFYYLLLICTRESRHTKCHSTKWAELKEIYGEKAPAFTTSILDAHSTTAVDTFLANPPEMSLGLYTKYLVSVFNTHGSFSSGFGGKAWGKVATALHEFVHGNYSPEVLLDTAYSLAHNNGPIFNKNILYLGYSSDFIKILDVQRSGQIPQYINSVIESYITTKLTSYTEQLFKEFPNESTDGISWTAVNIAGGHSKYYDAKNPVVHGKPNILEFKGRYGLLELEQVSFNWSDL